MRNDSLSEHFTGIAAKRISAVEADPERSNQHEFNGVAGLIKLFGKMEYGDKRKFPTVFLYLDDDPENTEKITDSLTWYESREAPRSEHRFYYRKSEVTEKYSEGDLAVFGRQTDDNVMLIVARQGSVAEKQLLWLFSLSAENLEKVEYKDLSEKEQELGFAAKMILEELGIEAVHPENSALAEMLKRFGGILPPTSSFSEFAREKAGIKNPVDDPDMTLIAWVKKEEELFRAFEKHLVAGRLREGFGKGNDDVDAFIDFSLSVHNRRKARMGKSFENHLKQVFSGHGLQFSYGQKTERKRMPDFLFPGIREYRDPKFSSELLTMLGAKSTCKERWAQVLNEADRVQQKHLITLEPGITEDQTDEMESSGLQLVVPSEISKTYTSKQQKWLMSVAGFIALVKQRQLLR